AYDLALRLLVFFSSRRYLSSLFPSLTPSHPRAHSLVVHVPAGEAASSSQRVVRIFHTKRNKEITRMSYSSSVLAVKMNRKTLVVLIETAIYIYDIPNMHLLHTISGTPPNPNGASSCGGREGKGEDQQSKFVECCVDRHFGAVVHALFLWSSCLFLC